MCWKIANIERQRHNRTDQNQKESMLGIIRGSQRRDCQCHRVFDIEEDDFNLQTCYKLVTLLIDFNKYICNYKRVLFEFECIKALR